MRRAWRGGVDNPVDGTDPCPLLVLYDADCGFCTTSSRAMTNRWFRADAEARSFQSVTLDDFGLTVDKCAEKLHVVDGTRVFTGGQAVALVLRRSRLPWPLVGLLMTLPGVRVLTEWVYGLVARNRHRLPGGSAACEMPPPDAPRA
jgi:predicted DCC family thiol-disulfide oxidoreductase YuxK